MEKTNASRILDKLHVAYEIVHYETDDDVSAIHIAAINNFDVESLYKTLVLQGDKTGIIVAIVGGDKQLSLKTMASLSGNKRCALLPTKDLLKHTGYIRGGCSPIGMKKKYPTYLDEASLLRDFIYVNAGKKGLQLKIKPEDLVRVVDAVVSSLV